jgi:hypothetical protein
MPAASPVIRPGQKVVMISASQKILCAYTQDANDIVTSSVHAITG